MTQEEKAKAYDEALEKAKSMIDDLRKGEDILAVSNLESMFPELKESEDERIRKGLIKGLTAMRDIHQHQTFSDDAININDAIDWLNRQGTINYCSDCINRKGCINCIEGNLRETNLTEIQKKILALSKPRSKEAIEKAEKRKEKRKKRKET